jgi:predicted flap endonuclease-1-like 5' DNA nuclease
MPLANLIRSVLGLGSSDRDASESTSVTVEREPDEGAATEADANAAGETGSAESDTESVTEEPETDEPDVEETDEPDAHADEEVDESAAAGTDAAGSTGSITQEPPGEAESAAEPAEAAGGVTEHSGTDSAAAEDAEAAGPVEEEPEGGEEPVENVSGIGPAYASRLNDAGVETVADLLAADPDDLADRIDVSAKRIGRWQDAAEDV